MFESGIIGSQPPDDLSNFGVYRGLMIAAPVGLLMWAGIITVILWLVGAL